MLRALALALVALGFTATTASAGTLTLAPMIQGAGTITIDGATTCTQEEPASEITTTFACPTLTKSAPGDAFSLVATAPPGWQFWDWVDCPTPVLATCTVGVSPSSRTVTPRARFRDIKAPVVTFGEVVRSPTSERSASVSWSADEPGVTYRCSVDERTPASCTSPLTVEEAEGPHRVTVYATDMSHRQSNAAQEFQLLDTRIVRGPVDGALVNTADVEFEAYSDATKDFDCQLDGSPWMPCKDRIQLPTLQEGKHTLLVRSRLGTDVDLLPARRTFTIDMTPPDTSLWLQDDAPTFAFAGTEPGSTFKCRVDSAAFAPCKAPRQAGGLPPGPHTFEVQAVDPAGNADPTPAKRTWTVAAPPTPTPTPTPAPATQPIVVNPTTIVAAPQPKPSLRLRYQFRASRTGTVFTRLSVTGAAAGEKVAVKVKCPRRVKRCPKPFTVTGSASLKPLIGKRLKPGTRISVAGKTITIRRSRAPRLT